MLPVKEIQHTVDGPASSGDAVKPDNSPSLDSEPVQEDIQSKLRSIWAKVLHDDPANFTGDDVFFEVGGDSITAQHLIDAAAKDGIRLTMEQIFMHATLEDMAEIAQMTVPLPELPALEVDCNSADQDHLDTAASQLHLPAGSIEAAYDLTPMQESLLVEEEERPNSYTRQFVFRVRPNCDLDHLRHAWTETIRASPVLRTRFFHVEGQGKQQVVFRDDAEIVAWTTFHSSLAAFLKQDARSPMLVGDRFFRYSIIQDSEAGDTHFVWTVSHALCDGHSVVEILSDVARQFQGQEVPVRPPFHLFVQSSAVKPEPIHERHFWTRALSDVHPKPYPTLPQHLEFRPNPSATLEHCITLDQLPPFGVTKSLLLRTAWAILLSHYTGNEEVVFGVINNGRSSVVADVSLITGPTINLVPCALGVDPKQPVSVLLSRVRLQAAEMMPFEHSGLSRIRKFLSSGSSQHPTAIDLQSLLVVHHASFTDTIAPWMQKLGLQYRDNLGKKEQHSFPLVLTFVLSNKSTDATRILLRIEHDDRVISSPQVLHLAHHLQAILTQLSHATQDTLVESINPLSDHDLHQISVWNASTPPGEETCLHHLFERQARHSPDAIAVCSVERSLTYAEVNAYASALSMQLVELSVRPEVFVGVCFEKSIWTVVAILAVLKAGGAYVPIDPAHPPSRIQEIIQTVGIRVVLASPTGRNILERLIGPEELSIVQVRDGCTPRLYVEPPSVANPSNTAYLLFTSGSTGKPKGILMPHRAICTSILHHGPAFGAGPHWRTLQFCAHTFDLSVAEFFTTLSFGGCVCIPSEEDRTENLAGAITSLAANTLIVVPTVANLLFPEEVPTLKTLILSGEPIPKESITRWADHVDLTCAYGPSETAVWCSGNINVSSEANHADVGHSIGGTMWVVDADDHGTLAAVGCIGEIAISGAIVGSGYFGDQDTTDAAFVMAPEWIRNLTGDTMLYRSGDLGRYNPDGSFQVVGRRDTQVKLRGLRIELGEIENRLTQGGVVAAALAFLPPIGPAAGRIVAVVSQAKSNLHQDAAAAPTTQGRADIIAHRPRGSSDELVARLKQRLRSTLPDYMVPSIWIVLERMPLLISGKIDRKSLKIWVQEMSANIYNDVVGSEQDGADGAAVVPGSLADQLRQLWADVLPLSADDITLSTSFFAAGGDSIAAIQIVSQARRTLPDLRLSARAIINAKTLGNLATLLEDEEHQRREQQQQQKHNAPSVSLQNLTPGSGLGLLAPYQSLVASRLAAKPTTAKIQIQDAYALSPFQREVVRARDTNPAVLLMSWRMELWSLTHESLSLPRLVWAWRSVVARFPVLRSIFLKDAPKRLGLPVMQVLLSRNAAADASVLVSESSAGDPEPVFDDLVVPPVDDSFLPHRAHVIRHGERTYLQVEMDHLLIDGWSLGLIKKALLEAYETESTYSGVTSSYKAFIAAQTAPERVLADDEYWACRLHDLSPSLLSAALPEPDPASRQHKRIRKTLIPLPSISAASLIPYGAARGVTSASLFSAAWAQTLSHFTGRDDVAYEFIVSGRDEDIGGNSATSAWDLVGCCINVLVHRVQVDTDLAGLGSRIQEASDEGVRRQSSNIREVAQKATSAKLFDTAINFQRRAAAVENEMHTLRVDDDLKRSVDPWHFDVLVRVLEITDDNTFRLSLEFFGQDYSPEAMQKVGEHWWHIVRNVTI
ncbi:acetyl-CoA synthetase-like protein [Xylariomycetidae sp. FL2044]|nr:acetyl-CoA synthetase-like protein [Xylariomycetidae sp. FL2044]